MSTHGLLGPQHPAPALKECLTALGARGPFVSITAGWQEREGETDELSAHIGAPVLDLALYRRAEALLRADMALAQALRERQDRLQRLQEQYRVRLKNSMAALLELEAMAGEEAALRRARRAALGDLRRLDRDHERAVVREHASFARLGLDQRSRALGRERQVLAELIGNAGTVLIAGGHVAILINRLELFALRAPLKSCRCVGWSAGAMVLAERIVLYHDHPPQGAAPPELFGQGLGLVSGVLPLPSPSTRLQLEDRAHLSRLSRRFAPLACLLLDLGSWVEWGDGRATRSACVRRLSHRGAIEALSP